MRYRKPANPTRNKYACLTGHIQAALPMNEGSGTTLTNLGKNFAATGITAPNGAANFTITDAGAWAVDAQGDPYLDFEAGGGHAVIWDHSGGSSDIVIPDVTILVVASKQTLGQQRRIFHSGNLDTAQGTLRAFFQSDDTIRVNLRDGSMAHFYDFAPDPTKPCYLAVTAGRCGYRAWCDGVALTSESACTVPMTIAAGKQFLLGNNPNSVGSGAQIWMAQVMACAFDDDMAEQFMLDPMHWMRGGPSDYFGDWVGPKITRSTNKDGARRGRVTFSLGTVNNFPVGDDCAVRCTVSTQPTMSPVIVAVERSTADLASKDMVQFALETPGVLETGQRYYMLAEWTEDGIRYEPFPCGLRTWVQHLLARHRMPDEFLHRVEHGFDVLLSSDDHTMNDETIVPDGTVGPDVIDILDAGSDRRTMKAVAEHDWACWRKRKSFAFSILGGDHVFPFYLGGGGLGVDLTEANIDRWAQFLNYRAAFFSTAVLEALFHGNHEDEEGYFQRGYNGSVFPLQMLATTARKIMLPMPTHLTHPEGGENEGMPTLDNDLDWLPPVNSIGADGTIYDGVYRQNFCIGSRGLNGSPLENYYSFTWGDAQFWILDPFRYTLPGDPQPNGNIGNKFRANRPWRLGDKQWEWFERTLAESQAKWKFACLHHLLGGYIPPGEDPYGRGSGREVGEDKTLEEWRFHLTCLRHRFTGVIKGHDHKFAVYVHPIGGLRYITLPTPSAQNLTTASTNGWNSQQFNDSYGFANRLGQNIPGMERMHNALGCAVLKVRPDRCWVEFDNTSITLTNSGVAPYQRPAWKERWISEEITPQANLARVEDGAVPNTVAFVALSEDTPTDGGPGKEWWDTAEPEYLDPSVANKYALPASAITVTTVGGVVQASAAVFNAGHVGKLLRVTDGPSFRIAEFISPESIRAVGAPTWVGAKTFTIDGPSGLYPLREFYRNNQLAIGTSSPVRIFSFPRTLYVSQDLLNADLPPQSPTRALRAMLMANIDVVALVGDRVSPAYRPQDEPMPSVVIHEIASEEVQSTGGPSGLAIHRVQIDCYAGSQAEALATREAVNRAIAGYAGNPTDFDEVGAVLLEQRLMDYTPPDDASDRGVFRGMIEVSVAMRNSR